MGYSTDFSGEINIDPPLYPVMVETLNDYCSVRHQGEEGAPGIWCDFEVSEDGKTIQWNGSEKSYEMAKWMKVLINKFIKRANSVANGTMHAQGEDASDRWDLVVRDNKVFVQSFEHTPANEERV